MAAFINFSCLLKEKEGKYFDYSMEGYGIFKLKLLQTYPFNDLTLNLTQIKMQNITRELFTFE